MSRSIYVTTFTVTIGAKIFCISEIKLSIYCLELGFIVRNIHRTPMIDSSEIETFIVVMRVQLHVLSADAAAANHNSHTFFSLSQSSTS